ncbi:MAG: hypothetical protein ACYTG0_12535 [Planctomycetota bacterium]|jgi:hypothetical protein
MGTGMGMSMRLLLVPVVSRLTDIGPPEDDAVRSEPPAWGWECAGQLRRLLRCPRDMEGKT